MKKLLTLIAFICFSANAQAQYVNIPDSNFRKVLIRYYPTCFDSIGRLDTTSADILKRNSLSLYGGYGGRYGIENLDGIQYFKNLVSLESDENKINYIPKLSDSVEEISIRYNYCKLDSISSLPIKLRVLRLDHDSISTLPNLPNNLEEFYCENNQIITLPSLPNTINKLDCSANKITSLPPLPNQLTYLACTNNLLINLPSLPSNLLNINCQRNQLINMPNLPLTIQYINCYENSLTSLPTLPNTLKKINCSNNQLVTLPILPSSLETLDCSNNKFTTLPQLTSGIFEVICNDNLLLTSVSNFPNTLYRFTCNNSSLTSIPNIPSSLKYLTIMNNKLLQLPKMDSSSLQELNCNNNFLTLLPKLPSTIWKIGCSNNKITVLPSLPNSLTALNCSYNLVSQIPFLGNHFSSLACYENPNLFCLPKMPASMKTLIFDNTRIKCVDRAATSIYIFGLDNYPICNPTNNVNNCEPYPTIIGNVFFDENNNGIKDQNDFSIRNVKVQYSNTRYAFTDMNGNYRINSDTLGLFGLSVNCPNFTITTPNTFTYDFISYDTLIIKNIALKRISLKDSLIIDATALNFAARPGFQYAYKVSYENVGTTVLSPIINFNYDANVLTYDSSSNGAVSNVGNSLNLTVGSFVPGQNSSFIAYFKVKTTATLGSNVLAIATINAANVTAADSVQTNVRGSYDPNDKQATPYLTQAECADDTHFINYTVRFQNTGTDTAFTVVVADTLSNLVQPNTLQLTSLSHNCKVTVNDKTVYFEFTNINLPDSNVNKMGSNGFVSFKVKPLTTLTTGTIVHNKAAIYFDYNEAVITNTAKTIIGSPLH